MNPSFIALLAIMAGGQGSSSVGAPMGRALAFSGPNSSIRVARQVVVRSQDQFDKLWREHNGRVGRGPGGPVIDFKGTDVIAVFAGPKNTGGHSVSIDSVKASGKKATVTVTVHKPGPGTIVTQAFTYPFAMKAVPKLPANVTFKVTEA